MSDKDKNYIGHEKDTMRSLYPASIKSDRHLEFIVRKLERIPTAIYMVASVMPHEEPLRTILRDRTLELIEQKMSILGKRTDSEQDVFKSLSLSLLELVSYFEVALHAGLLSAMNHRILKEECERLGSMIGEREGRESALGVSFDTHFFNTGHAFSQRSQKEPHSSPVSEAGGSAPVGHFSLAKEGVSHYGATESSSSRVAEKKKGRRELILNLLQTKNDISIKDFSAVIKECSEKTIQRELLEMVVEGVIEKRGERRWSTYSLRK